MNLLNGELYTVQLAVLHACGTHTHGAVHIMDRGNKKKQLIIAQDY